MNRIRVALGLALMAAAALAAAQDTQTRTGVRIQSSPTVRAVAPTRAGQALVYGTQSTPYAVTASGFFDSTKVSPDLDNVKVGDAVKRVLESAGKEVDLEGDIPDTRISLKAKDVRLNTFMDLVSQASGAGWSVEMKDGKAKYKFGKNLKPFGNWVFDSTSARALRVWDDAKNKTLFNGLNKGTSFLYTDPGTGVSTFQNYIGAERRSSFTCPHCKGHVTAIRTVTAPKCPKCSRTFQSGWEYCPADGTKRPSATAGEWKHCPLCGKEVDFSKAETKRSSTLEPLSIPAVAEAASPAQTAPARK